MSCLPLAHNLIDIRRALTTSSTAIFVPFTTQELFQAGKESLYYGLNALSNNLIMVDRKALKNPNGLILGTPGSGKSFSAKREITNAFLVTDDDVIICDPEAEYSALVEKLKGQVIHISPASSIYEPCQTIRGVDRPIPPGYQGHPSDPVPIGPQVRALTILERSYVQTFPKEFIFKGNKTNLNQMIGNAVPVKLAEYVASAILEYDKQQGKEQIFVVKSYESYYESNISPLLIKGQIQEQLQETLAARKQFLKILEKASGLKIQRTVQGKKKYELEPQIIEDFAFTENSILLNLDELDA